MGSDKNLEVIRQSLEERFDFDASRSQKRLAKNGMPYLQCEFEEYYGPQWENQWENAPRVPSVILVSSEGELLVPNVQAIPQNVVDRSSETKGAACKPQGPVVARGRAPSRPRERKVSHPDAGSSRIESAPRSASTSPASSTMSFTSKQT